MAAATALRTPELAASNPRAPPRITRTLLRNCSMPATHGNEAGCLPVSLQALSLQHTAVKWAAYPLLCRRSQGNYCPKCNSQNRTRFWDLKDLWYGRRKRPSAFAQYLWFTAFGGAKVQDFTKNCKIRCKLRHDGHEVPERKPIPGCSKVIRDVLPSKSSC